MQITVEATIPKKQGVGKTGKPWTISEVTAGGVKYDTFDSFAVGETVEVDVEPNANPQYNAKIKKAKASNNYQNTKNAEVSNKILADNSEKEQRITMLSCLSTAASFYRERQADEDKMIAFAKKLFDVAWSGKDRLPF